MELATGGWKGTTCCEQSAPPPEAVMKSQSILPMRAMSGSLVMPLQGSVSISIAHITNTVHAGIPGLGSHLGPQISPSISQWLRYSGEMSLPLTNCSTQGSTVELALVGGGVSWSRGYEGMRADPATCVL